MTQSTEHTNQSSQATTNPWAPTQPLLNQLLGSYGGQSTAVTGAQSGALANLQGAANSIPNFGKAGSGAVNSLFNATNAPQVGMLQSAYGNLGQNLSGLTNPANLNPMNTPGLSDALKTMTQDTTNAVKGVYAGSGRDPSGAGSFAQSLGRGITQGEAPTIANAYQANVGNLLGANNQLFSGANTAAQGISGLNQTALGENAMGITAGMSLPGLYTAPGQAQLGAANAAYSQPYSNLSQLLQPSTIMAGLGGQGTTTGDSTKTLDPSWLSSITGLMGAGGTAATGLGSLAKLGGGAGLGGLFNFGAPPSDMRLKTDIAPVGKLNDGQTVHQFRFKGSPHMQIGLLAQEVEKVPHAAHAVHTLPSGIKLVDYGAATHKARMMGGGQVGALKVAA